MPRIQIAVLLFVLPVLLIAQKKDLAPTPPMGWNTWNTFHCHIDEELVLEMANALVTSGMADAGYEYVVIDDCWQVDRDADGHIVADPERFPSGIAALADSIHALGLKFGIYSDAGFRTCQGRPGSFGYEATDAATYAAWGVDYLKYDWCAHRLKRARRVYPRMAAALAAQERDIVFSVCNWGWGDPWEWAPDIAHLWRTTWDIEASFAGSIRAIHLNVLQILDRNEKLARFAGPGAWNDPDMLEVGNGDLTTAQNRAHFSLWCMMAAPLMAGNDLRTMPDSVRDVLTHPEVIAIDQDPLGVQGFRVGRDGPVEIWLKPLSNGDKAVCFFNRSGQPTEISIDFSGRFLLRADYFIRDVWAGDDLGSSRQKRLFLERIAPWDVRLYRLDRVAD